MYQYTFTALDASTATIEWYNTSTGLYKVGVIEHPAPSPGDTHTPLAVTSDGYAMGFNTSTSEDMGTVLGAVYVSKVGSIPSPASSVGLAMYELAEPAAYQAGERGVILTQTAAVVVRRTDLGSVDVDIAPYGSWPVQTGGTLVVSFTDGSARLLQADVAAGVLRLSTAIGGGAPINVQATIPLTIPPLGTATPLEARRWGALTAAKGMQMAKAFGSPLASGSGFVFYHEVGVDPYIAVDREVSASAPNDAQQYDFCRLSDDTSEPVTETYTADPWFTSFTLTGSVTSPDPTGLWDAYWLVAAGPIYQNAFWTSFKKCEEQV